MIAQAPKVKFHKFEKVITLLSVRTFVKFSFDKVTKEIIQLKDHNIKISFIEIQKTHM